MSITLPTLAPTVLEAAICSAGRLEKIATHFDQRTLNQASDLYPRGGPGLQEMLLDAAWANGYRGRRFSDDPREAMRFAFGEVRASYATIDIAGILSNVANKFMLDGFNMTEQSWREISSIRRVKDFKESESYRLIGDEEYEKLGPTEEIRHGTLGEEKFSNKADTYAKMFTISRTDIVNDDMGALTTVARKLGRGSGLSLHRRFWREWLDNSAFFTSGNGNYLEGATTGLGIDSLSDAVAKFTKLKDAQGHTIGLRPAILLVPTELSAFAEQLHKSLEMRDTTASTKYPVANPHAGKYRPISSAYLSDEDFPGHSPKAWYLLADPRDLPVIEVVFLDGKEAPTIESADADFGKLGVEFRGYYDFGVAKQDPRGAVKIKGAA